MRAFILLLFLLAGIAVAEPVLTVQSLSYQGKVESYGEVRDATEGQYNMPFVQAGDKAVAASINSQLFQGQFNVAAPLQADKYFTLADAAGLEGMASQTFSVTRNDGHILTIVFDNEGCGAYCENYQVIYSFDVNTGKKIVPEDIFTADGMHRLANRLQQARQAAYRKMLVSLRNDLREARKKNEANTAETISDLEERITMNSECAGEGGHTDRTPRVVEPVQGFAYDKVELAEKSLRLTRERCSNHAMRALDDVGDFTLDIPYPELAPYLTDAGKRLLLDNTALQQAGKNKSTVKDDSGDESLLFFPAPQDGAAELVWTVGGDPVKAGAGWWILACEQACALHTATLKVSDAKQDDDNGTQIPVQKLQWLPVPPGNVIAIFKPVAALAAMPLKAGAVKTWLHAGMDSYPDGRADTIEIAIPLTDKQLPDKQLPDKQPALLVPRVTSAGSEKIDRLELRLYGKRQALPGVTLPGEGGNSDPQHLLPWAGDLDGDGKLDLIVNHDSNGIDVAVYLSSLAQPGELVGFAGSMRYEQSGSGD